MEPGLISAEIPPETSHQNQIVKEQNARPTFLTLRDAFAVDLYERLAASLMEAVFWNACRHVQCSFRSERGRTTLFLPTFQPHCPTQAGTLSKAFSKICVEYTPLGSNQ